VDPIVIEVPSALELRPTGLEQSPAAFQTPIFLIRKRSAVAHDLAAAVDDALGSDPVPGGARR
jgi:hypothetical protein